MACLPEDRANTGELKPKTSPLYGFVEGHIIPAGTIKLAITLRERPRVTTIMIGFLAVNCPSTFKGCWAGRESSDLNPLLNHEIPHCIRNQPSSRKTVRLHRVLPQFIRAGGKEKRATSDHGGRKDKHRADGNKHQPSLTRR